MKRIICLIIFIMTVIAVPSCNKETLPAEKKAEEKQEKNGTLTIYSLKDDTLCPIMTDNEANKQLLSIIYEPLVELKTDMDISGVLAESWSVSEDGLSWKINIRKNVKWHNGELLSAEDVAYTVNQIKAVGNSIYSYNVRHIAEMEVTDMSIVMKLTEPCANFMNLMTFPIMKRSDEEIDRVTYFPCGTGAYRLSDNISGNEYCLLRNENWWKGKAKLDKINVKLLPDGDTVSYSFLSRDIDIANSKWGEKSITGGADVKTISCPLSVYDYIGINHSVEGLKNTEVRRAIDMAVNRMKITNDIFAGNATPANIPLREEWFVYSGENNYEADSLEAENLLLKNLWKKEDGVYSKEILDNKVKLEFEMIVNEDNDRRVNIAEWIKTDIEAIGIKINIVKLPFEEYEERILSGDYQLFLGSTMIPDDLDLSYFFGEGNIFAYEDESLIGILEEINLSRSKEDLVKNYEKMKNRFMVETPVVGICFENFDMLYNKKVAGELNSTQSNIYSGIYNLEIGK